jgi:hypothetical protein
MVDRQQRKRSDGSSALANCMCTGGVCTYHIVVRCKLYVQEECTYIVVRRFHTMRRVSNGKYALEVLSSGWQRSLNVAINRWRLRALSIYLRNKCVWQTRLIKKRKGNEGRVLLTAVKKNTLFVKQNMRICEKHMKKASTNPSPVNTALKPSIGGIASCLLLLRL